MRESLCEMSVGVIGYKEKHLCWWDNFGGGNVPDVLGINKEIKMELKKEIVMKGKKIEKKMVKEKKQE